MQRKLRIISVVVFGVSSLIAQVLIIRQFLENFWGNEIAIGITLGSWLIGAAMGSILLGKLLDRINFTGTGLAKFQIFLSLALPSMVFLSRIIKTVFGLPYYTIPSPVWVMASIQIIIIPMAMLFGFGFVLFCNVAGYRFSGKVYMYEAIGSFIGGTVFSFILIQLLNPVQIISIIAFLNSLLAFLILTSGDNAKLRFFTSSTAAAICLAALIFILPGPSGKLNLALAKIQWDKTELIGYKDSKYGNIAIIKSAEQYSVYESGSLFYSTTFTAANEELAHIALLEHPGPKKILLIGGGMGGLVSEILKHSVEQIDYIEFDPLLFKMTGKILSAYDRAALKDAKVKVLYGDARFFIKRVRAKYDVILVNLPNPSTIQLNRYYTREFFAEAAKILEEDGILFTGISSQPDIISKEMARYDNCIYKTLGSVFKDVIALPADTMFFIASKQRGILTCDGNIIAERFKLRDIQTRFLTEYYIKDKFYKERVDYLLSHLESVDAITKKNFDFSPNGFYYNTVLWWLRFYAKQARFFNSLIDLKVYALFICIILALSIFFILNKILFPKMAPINFTIFTTGFSGMSLEVMTITAFQIIYGFVYDRLSFIIASFMVGIALGSFIANKFIAADTGKLKKRLLAIDALMLVYILITPLIFSAANKAASCKNFAALEILFPVITAAAGLLVGLQFPVALSIATRLCTKNCENPGVIYGMDLLGASLGAFFLMLLIFPVCGLWGVFAVLALFKIVSIAGLFLSKNLGAEGKY